MIFLIYTILLTNFLNAETIDLSNYKLVWSDDFNEKHLNKNNWSHRYLGKRKKGYNSKDNLSFENDQYLKLSITRKNNKTYTAMIGTEGKFETKFGYFEARIKLQNKEASQSSFWLQSKHFGKVIGDLEKSGAEIDIFEYIKSTPNKIYHTIYYDGYGKDKKRITFNKSHENIDKNQWQTFGLLWEKDFYKFFINRKLIWKTKKGISKHKQYIVLSIESTNWSGEVKKNNFEDSLKVDYVKVYKRIENENSPTHINNE